MEFQNIVCYYCIPVTANSKSVYVDIFHTATVMVILS